MIGVAELQLYATPGRFGLPEFVVKRQTMREKLLIRGLCAVEQGSLHAVGMSHGSPFPRSLALQAASTRNMDLLVGAMSGATETSIAFAVPCAAVPVAAMQPEMTPDYYPLQDVAARSGKIHEYLAAHEPQVYGRRSTM